MTQKSQHGENGDKTYPSLTRAHGQNMKNDRPKQTRQLLARFQDYPTIANYILASKTWDSIQHVGSLQPQASNTLLISLLYL